MVALLVAVKMCSRNLSITPRFFGMRVCVCVCVRACMKMWGLASSWFLHGEDDGLTNARETGGRDWKEQRYQIARLLIYTHILLFDYTSVVITPIFIMSCNTHLTVGYCAHVHRLATASKQGSNANDNKNIRPIWMIYELIYHHAMAKSRCKWSIWPAWSPNEMFKQRPADTSAVWQLNASEDYRTTSNLSWYDCTRESMNSRPHEWLRMRPLLQTQQVRSRLNRILSLEETTQRTGKVSVSENHTLYENDNNTIHSVEPCYSLYYLAIFNSSTDKAQDAIQLRFVFSLHGARIRAIFFIG